MYVCMYVCMYALCILYTYVCILYGIMSCNNLKSFPAMPYMANNIMKSAVLVGCSDETFH